MKTFIRNLIARWLTRQVRDLIRQHDLRVVGVTGSYGKTSTKLAIAAVLGQKYAVLAHEGNYNSELGMPLSVFGETVPANLANPLTWLAVAARVRAKSHNYPYQALVLELGVDHPRDMDAFLRYLTPDIGVVTAVGPVHVEYFIDVEEIADEKFKLALGSKQAVINSDYDYLTSRAKLLNVDAITFGKSGQYHFDSTKTSSQGVEGDLCMPDKTLRVQTHVIAEHALRALEAAAAVGRLMGLNDAQIQAGVQAFRPVSGRMNPLPGVNGALIIDDTYNSSPDAVIAALNTLAELPGKRIAILGTMNELGDHSEAEHRRVGREAAKPKLDLLVTIGLDAQRYLADEAAKKMDKKTIISFMSPYEAGEYVRPLLTSKHVVLAKGSQNGVFAEEAVKLLLADDKDADKLVRQSAKWQKTKQEQFQ